MEVKSEPLYYWGSTFSYLKTCRQKQEEQQSKFKVHGKQAGRTIAM